MQPLPDSVAVDNKYAVDIAADHPATDGHFPGHPLIPGVVILEYVRVAMQEMNSSLTLRRFGRVKFSQPLLPGNRLNISIAPKGNDVYRFTCTDAASKTIASGEFAAERK